MFATRTDALAELRRQLAIMSETADPDGPFLAGPELSLADATVFPTMVFVWNMLPRFLPIGEAFAPEKEFPALARWYSRVQELEPAFKRVAEEVQARCPRPCK
jgi:glutathione S-transferase